MALEAMTRVSVQKRKRTRKQKGPPGPGMTPGPGGLGNGCESNQPLADQLFRGKDAAYSIFFSSSYTNCTLVPMTTWQVLLSGRMTPAAPAAFTAFSSTWV